MPDHLYFTIWCFCLVYFIPHYEWAPVGSSQMLLFKEWNTHGGQWWTFLKNMILSNRGTCGTSLCRVITGAAPLIFVWVDCAARELGWVCIIKKMRRWALSKSVLFCYKECSSAGIFYVFLLFRLWSYSQLHINCFFSVDNNYTPLLKLELTSQTFF